MADGGWLAHLPDRLICSDWNLMPAKATFFRSGDDFRRWLHEHSHLETELWVGYFKAASGKANLTWRESVDHALCYGWIDGVRKSIDEARYMIRFTPRKSSSTWSAVNVRRVEILIEQDRMQSAGLAAYQARRENQTGIYSYEQRPARLPEPYASVFAKNARALEFFSAQAASYRRAVVWWILSAKREETRQRRLEQLLADSTRRKRIKQFLSPKGK
jgi:uncharacterized protein YdeI (YjbR/CyaY-like superfamily)